MTSGMADSSNGFRIELLGPVEAWVDGRAVALGGQRPRTLFAVLGLMGGRVVTTGRLVDELWGEELPARARDRVQVHVWRLGELLGQLEALVIAHPFQEPLVELQMLALYRSGRQADALTAFQAARGRFVEELGIEPAQPLRELHEDILKHSTELSPPTETTLE